MNSHSSEQASQEEVSARLRELPVVPMPDDVWRRLESAVAVQRYGAAPVAAAGPRRQLNRREVALAAGASVVVALLLVAGLWKLFLTEDEPEEVPRAAPVPTEEYAADNAAPEVQSEKSADPMVYVSGFDYQRDTLASQLARLGSLNMVPLSEAGTLVPDLARLSAVDGLTACVAELSAVGLVMMLDYAAFEGKPALVVVAQTPDGEDLERLVFWVGPACAIGSADIYLSARIPAR